MEKIAGATSYIIIILAIFSILCHLELNRNIIIYLISLSTAILVAGIAVMAFIASAGISVLSKLKDEKTISKLQIVLLFPSFLSLLTIVICIIIFLFSQYIGSKLDLLLLIPLYTAFWSLFGMFLAIIQIADLINIRIRYEKRTDK
jgi:hypothetical protein